MPVSEVFNMDCMQYMFGAYENEFELSIVDPEYGIGEAGKNHKSRNTLVRQKGGQLRRCSSTNYTRKNWDDKPAGKDYFEELKRVSINQIIFGANYFESIMAPQKPPRREEFQQFLKDHPVGFIIWDKCNGTSDFSDCEVIYTSFQFDSYIIQYMWAGMMQGKSILEGHVMQGDNKKNEKRIHPTQKPVAIYRMLMKEYANGGDLILDTHIGSGSSRIAAYDLGFDFYGTELDKEYYDKQENRFGKYKSQLKLFP